MLFRGLLLGCFSAAGLHAAGCTPIVAGVQLNHLAQSGAVTALIFAPPGCAWTSSSSASWMTSTPNASGSGDGFAQFRILENLGAARSGQITVAGKMFTITQHAANFSCSYTVSGVPSTIPAAGGTYVVNVETADPCQVEAGAPVDWISTTPVLMFGKAQVNVRILPNEGPVRSTIFGAGFKTFTITQEAGAPPCVFNPLLFAPQSQHSASGAIGSFAFTAAPTCRWLAYTTSRWVEFYPIEGMGSATVTYRFYPSFMPFMRSAETIVAGRKDILYQAPNTRTRDERFVQLLYFSFLGRLPSAQDLALQVAQINNGVSRLDLVMRFLNSGEFNNGGRFIAGLYVGLLDRDAEYSGWLFQRNALATGVVDQLSLVRNFLGAPEYALKFGNPDDNQFIRLLYRYILLREPSDAEVAIHAPSLKTGQTRVGLANAFLNSNEFRLGAGPRLMAFLVYATLLQRDGTMLEQQRWRNLLQSGVGIEQVVAEMIVSQEFDMQILN